MRSPFVPVLLFLALVTSVIVSLPLEGSVVALSVIAFMGSLATLAWWILWADRRAAPPPPPVQAAAAEPFDADWQEFERDFWAHVAEHEATSDLD
jgi:hypothetical protein